MSILVTACTHPRPSFFSLECRMRWPANFGPVLFTLTICAWPLTATAAKAIDGISFADDPHTLFVPVEEIALALGWETQLNQESKDIFLNGQALDSTRLRTLTNGTSLVPLDELQRAGATTTWGDDGMQALVASGFLKKAAIRFAAKHVEVDLANQRLRADRKSTRLNSSHLGISYAVFCLKKKKIGQMGHVNMANNGGKRIANDLATSMARGPETEPRRVRILSRHHNPIPIVKSSGM